MKSFAVWFVVLLLAGCGETLLIHQEYGTEIRIAGKVAVEPGWPQWRAWAHVRECTGIERPTPHEVEWFTVTVIWEVATGRQFGGLANLSANRIYIERRWWEDWRISGAELLHLALGPGVREGHPEYDRCNPTQYPPEA